jgi:uncharacterized glyoxalase superfamily protein PhnB
VTTLGGLVTYLNIDGAAKAANLYEKAFDAKEVFRYPVDDKGRTMHIHLHVNGSSLMLGDFYPEHGHAITPAEGFTMTLIVDDIEMWCKRAADAGMQVTMPIQKMFWGDFYCQLSDPFGIRWAMNQPDKS